MVFGFRQRQKPLANRVARSVLDGLDGELAGLSEWLVDALRTSTAHPARIGALYRPLMNLSKVREVVGRLDGDPARNNGAAILEALRTQTSELTRRLQEERVEYVEQRLIYARATTALVGAERAVAKLARPVVVVPARNVARPRIVVPADLLYRAREELFPAERMVVVSGHRIEGAVRLGVPFDVTGKASAAHVQADPAKLARSLIGIDKSGAHLAAWLHSHPGRGAEGTRPSHIDLAQQQEWLRNYSPTLLGAILVQDGWIRFWGTALDKGTVQVEVVGKGVRREDEHGRIYRFTG